MIDIRTTIQGGFIRVVETMGNDASIVQAARISYGHGTKTTSSDRKLLRYLMKHRHTSPFEMCEIKLHIRLPIYIMRQWIRHRTANVNEYSARYSEIKNDSFENPELQEGFFYPTPDLMGTQSDLRKQCSEGSFQKEEYEAIVCKMKSVCDKAWEVYRDLLDNHKLARETARIILPVNAFTEAYWKIDAHNLMHFLKLRLASGAQKEIKIYAQEIMKVFKEWMPITAEAFEDYVLNSKTYSQVEYNLIANNINKNALNEALNQADLGIGEIQQMRSDFSL